MTVEIETHCPHCGAQNECASSAFDDGARPADGDLSFCFECGWFSIFDSSRVEGLRVATPDENDTIRNTEECQRVYKAWLVTRKIK